MAIRRLNGRATLLRRVEDLEVLVGDRPERPPTREEQWQAFVSLAPVAVVDYIMDVDAEVLANRQAFDLDPKQWFYTHHPLLKHVDEALHCAVLKGMTDRLSYVQARTVMMAEWTLAWWFARERAAGKTGVVYDHWARGRAAEALLAWSAAESHEAWVEEPLRYLAQWRDMDRLHVSAETLAAAGLHAAELALLAREDD